MAKNVQIKTWRGKLALLCLRKGLSHQTILDIGYIISDKEWEQGEMLARKAIDIVESVNDEQESRTEEEILEKIKKLYKMQQENITRILWNTIDDMKLQPDTELKILRKIMSYGISKETEMEQKILDIINSTESEDEIVAKVKAL